MLQNKGSKMEDGYAEFVTSRTKDPSKIAQEMTPKAASLLHGAVGLCGEVGELLDAVYMGRMRDKENIVEELGDIAFYSTMILSEINIELPPASSPYVSVSINDTETAVCAMSVFAASLLDLAKKLAIYGDVTVLIKKHEFSHLLSSIRDLCLSVMIDVGVTEKFVLEENMKKLSKRYENGYTDNAAKERADKNGQEEAQA